jgi:hypothetical protein
MLVMMLRGDASCKLQTAKLSSSCKLLCKLIADM